MLHDALDAFARLDVDAAIATAAQDLKIDHEFESLSRLLITHMMEDPRQVKNVIKMTWCARSLKRIGDHAKNVCEYLIYMGEGKNVRHTALTRCRN